MRTSEERWLDLLVAEATQGLSPEERAELESLRRELPNEVRWDLEKAAAAIDLAGTPQERAGEGPPPELTARLQEQAARHFGFEAAPRVLPFPAAPRPAAPPLASGRPWLAVAASLLAAVLGWAVGRSGERPAPLPPPQSPLELAQAAAAAPEALVWTFKSPGEGDGELIGTVAWNPRSQAGLMRFRGLPANDPSREQYQLWIFDQAQDERYPIDGGVFDVQAGATEALVPIVAKLRVSRPTLFAVTVEKPGGVVVSSRERIAALASG